MKEVCEEEGKQEKGEDEKDEGEDDEDEDEAAAAGRGGGVVLALRRGVRSVNATSTSGGSVTTAAVAPATRHAALYVERITIRTGLPISRRASGSSTRVTGCGRSEPPSAPSKRSYSTPWIWSEARLRAPAPCILIGSAPCPLSRSIDSERASSSRVMGIG